MTKLTIMKTDHILKSMVRVVRDGDHKWYKRIYNSTTGITTWHDDIGEVDPHLHKALEELYRKADQDESGEIQTPTLRTGIPTSSAI